MRNNLLIAHLETAVEQDTRCMTAYPCESWDYAYYNGVRDAERAILRRLEPEPSSEERADEVE